MSWDTIVVGSGFGGSVTALRLAEAGMNTLVLERGPWWGPRLRGDVDVERRAYPRGRGWLGGVRNVVWAKGEKTRSFELSPQGLLEFHLHPRLLAWTASGVGGGSLIYTDILMRPASDFWGAFPAEMTEEELAPHFERFLANMRPKPLPEERRREDVRPHQMREASRRAGREPFYPKLAIQFDEAPEANAAGVHQPPCVHCGECFVGCPTGAKTTLDRTYLPAAVRAGASIWDMCEVTAIARHDHGYCVHYCDRRDGTTHVEHAPRLVMATGALNTMRLLNDAHHRHRSVEIPASLGGQFSANGDMMAVAWGERSPEGPLGPSYPSLVEARHDDGVDAVWGEVGFPAAAFGGPRIAEKLRSAYIFFAIGQDKMRAGVRTGPNGIQLQASRQDAADYYAAGERFIDELMDAYQLSHTLPNLPGGPGSDHLTCVHPMGGASIGRGPDEGVVDHRGEVFGNPGLYVADGSLYPAEPGVPPSLTIAALAERQAELMVEAASPDLRAERVTVTVPQTIERTEIAVRPQDLSRLTPPALVRTWQQAPAAEVAQVQGELAGFVVQPRGTERLPAIARRVIRRLLLTPLVPWRAKHIIGTHGHNHFGVGRGQLRFGEFELRLDTSWEGQGRVLALDYDVIENPAWLRRIRGELRRLEPRLFLGRMGWRSDGAMHQAMFFALEGPPARRRSLTS